MRKFVIAYLPRVDVFACARYFHYTTGVAEKSMLLLRFFVNLRKIVDKLSEDVVD